jgi:hypothetical protein
MEKLYTVGLTNEQVANGALSIVADIIREAFLNSARQVSERKLVGAQKHWAKVYFEHNLMNDNFPKDQKEYSILLHLNGTAKFLIEKSGYKLKVISELEEAPDDLGTFLSIPYYE